MSQLHPPTGDLFKLEYPQSVGVYDSYPEAQKVVDFLADSHFAVQNLCIVGTELRSVERVLGRRTWGTVLGAGLQNGLTSGIMVSLLLWVLQPGVNVLEIFLIGLAMGLVVGVFVAVLGFALSRGRRDFNSVSQIVATKYEILAEHKVAQQARELVATMPGARAAMFAPAGGQTPYPQPQQPYPPMQQPYPSQLYPPQQPYPYPQPYPPVHPQQGGEQPPYPPASVPQRPYSPDVPGQQPSPEQSFKRPENQDPPSD